MELVTFHPRWNVPESIKVRELYPSLARGSGYFQKQGLKLMQNGHEVSPSSVDWGSADIRRFDIFQPPGGSNVLGVVKFSFPNKHSVYMHDTGTKNLFNETSRPFSHGCMRVRNPVKLAELVLGQDKGWDAGQVAQMVNGPVIENPITLDHKIPVHVTYFTNWAADDGKVSSFRDVYGHEERIALALDGKWGQIKIPPDHLAPVKYDPNARIAAGQWQGPKSIGDFLNSVLGGGF